MNNWIPLDNLAVAVQGAGVKENIYGATGRVGVGGFCKVADSNAFSAPAPRTARN